MRKMRSVLQSFGTVIFFCLRVAFQSSKKYFIFRLILNAIATAVPFVIISFTSQLINLLVSGQTGSGVTQQTTSMFLLYSLLILGLNIVSRSGETLKIYCEGLHNETMQTITRQMVMEKSAKLDLSFFDSSHFYDELNDANMNSALITQAAFQAIELIRFFVQFLIAFVILVQWNLWFAMLLAVSIIPNTIAQNQQLKSIYSFQREHMNEERKMNYTSGILLSQQHAKDVRVYKLFPFIQKKYLDTWKLLVVGRADDKVYDEMIGVLT